MSACFGKREQPDLVRAEEDIGGLLILVLYPGFRISCLSNRMNDPFFSSPTFF